MRAALRSAKNENQTAIDLDCMITACDYATVMRLNNGWK